MDPHTEEQIARAMRDALMEHETSDNNWDACKGHYIRNLAIFERRLAELGLHITAIPRFNVGLAGTSSTHDA